MQSKSHRFVFASLVLLLGTPHIAPADTVAPQILIGSASGSAGSQVSVAATLNTGGLPVVGTQNDITFDASNVRIAVSASGKPDCTVNASLHKNASAFAFNPLGCSGVACASVRAIVFSVESSDPIPDGSTLYTCKVDISAGAMPKRYPLAIANVVLSDPAGKIISNSTGVAGGIVVTVPSPTATQTRAPPATPTGTPGPPLRVVLEVGTAAGSRLQQVSFGVTLRNNGTAVAGTQNDITFDATTPIAANASGEPDCSVNPAINKPASAFAFRPVGCSAGACTGIRAVIFSTSDSGSIPDFALLYSCRVNIAGNAPFTTVPLTISDVYASNPTGQLLAAAGKNGKVLVTSVAPSPTPTSPPRPAFVVGSATDLPNHRVEFTTSLRSMGAMLAGAQIDISFAPATQIDANGDGSPECTVNANIDKTASSFRFQPAHCTPGTDCDSIRAIIVAFDNVDPIPDGATLFTCAATIERSALPGTYPLRCSGPAGSDPAAHSVSTACTSGTITVLQPCPGDCDGSGEVTIEDLLLGVNVAQDTLPYAQCPAFDTDANGDVTIDELLEGVLNSLHGCP